MLRAHGPRGRVALQARLDEEERAAGGGAQDARRGAREDVDAEGLDGLVAVDRRRQGPAQRLVEAQPAPVQQDLVDVGGADAAVDAEALVAHDHRDAVEGAFVEFGLVAFVLELALELHAGEKVSVSVWLRNGLGKRGEEGPTGS